MASAMTSDSMLTNGSATSQNGSVLPITDDAISADEIALYDRQIRLWGMQAQEQIRNANILLVTMKALGNEIAKNLVLAGIGSLTVSDSGLVTEDDLGAQFFVTEEDIGKSRADAALPRIQKLNNRVNVSILPDAGLLTSDPSTALQPFTLVLATDLPINSLNALNAACRISNKPFYCAGTHGLFGFIFADLLTHTFAISRQPSNNPTTPGTAETPTRTVLSTTVTRPGGPSTAPTELVTKRENYQPLILANSSPLPPSIGRNPRKLRAVPPLLPCLRALWDFESRHAGAVPSHTSGPDLVEFTTLATSKARELQLPFDHLKSDFLRSFLQNIYVEVVATSAFLGAAVAQDVINVLGKREQPVQNMVFFDGEEGRAEVLALFPIVTTADASI